MKATIIEINTALRIRANCDYTDSRGNNRLAGEELLIRDQGPYIPSAEETIVDPICATLLSDTNALRLEAIVAFTDIMELKEELEKNGSLLTSYLPHIFVMLMKSIEKRLARLF